MNDIEDLKCLAVSPYVHRYNTDFHYNGDNEEEARALAPTSVALTPNGKYLASGDNDGHIFLWDTRAFLL
jgi:WD40 repeat protein